MADSPILLYPRVLTPRREGSASGSASASLFQRDALERIAGAAMLETIGLAMLVARAGAAMFETIGLA